jgi:hypothetical protein
MDSDDKKITQLTQVTTLSDSDVFVVSIDVGTAPKTRAILKSNALLPRKQMLLGNALNATVPSSSTNYIIPGTTEAPNASAFNIAITEACTISNLIFTNSGAQPGTGSLVVTVQKNNADTAITATLAAGAGTSTVTDLVNSVSFAAGDLLIIKVVNNATGASATISRHSLLVTFN